MLGIGNLVNKRHPELGVFCTKVMLYLVKVMLYLLKISISGAVGETGVS